MNSKQILACCVHPEKTCIALQVSEVTLILLFLKERSAEEVKLTFQKAKQIHAFSFIFGDDFNFFVATNFSIDLYKIKLGKQKAKLIKNIPLQGTFSGEPTIFYDCMTATIVLSDSKGLCQPYFLNLYKGKTLKGKAFQMDIGSVPSAEVSESQLPTNP